LAANVNAKSTLRKNFLYFFLKMVDSAYYGLYNKCTNHSNIVITWHTVERGGSALIEIDKYSRTPIYEQIVNAFEQLIASAELKPNEVLPSVRVLSQKLSINPNTLQKAYAELERKGLCYSVPGSGRFIAEDAQSKVLGKKQELLQELKAIAEELRLFRVSLNEILEAVKAVFEKGG
jgi:GntR family transcriptional regulator